MSKTDIDDLRNQILVFLSGLIIGAMAVAFQGSVVEGRYHRELLNKFDQLAEERY